MKTRFQCTLLMSKNTVQRTSRHVTIVTIFRMLLCCDFRPNCCVTKKAQISLHATTFNPVERARRKKNFIEERLFCKKLNKKVNTSMSHCREIKYKSSLIILFHSVSNFYLKKKKILIIKVQKGVKETF